MINIQYKKFGKSNIKNVNKHNNMLIIAEGNSLYKVGVISHYTSYEKVKSFYGDSDLTESFKIAKDFGVEDIFILNVKSFSDYIDSITLLKHYDFSYIVPVGIKLSDSFFDYNSQKSINVAYYFLNSLSKVCDSTIIFTDEHASLYEDVDHFLIDMKEKESEVNNMINNTVNGEKLCFVANNLEDYNYANLIIASALCVSSLGEYPQLDFGESIFNIDHFDIEGHNIIYFKNNLLTSTTIENIKNMRHSSDALKDMNINKVITFIIRELDLSMFKGKLYTKQTDLLLYNMLSDFLQSIVGAAIRGYEIKNIYFEKTNPAAGTLNVELHIIPINSVEGFDLVMEV